MEMTIHENDLDMVIEAIDNGDYRDAKNLLEEIKEEQAEKVSVEALTSSDNINYN